MNTVLFVNATIGFSENLFLVFISLELLENKIVLYYNVTQFYKIS